MLYSAGWRMMYINMVEYVETLQYLWLYVSKDYKIFTFDRQTDNTYLVKCNILNNIYECANYKY